MNANRPSRMTTDYVATDNNGEIVAWAATIPGIIQRLRQCKAFVVYTVSGGILGQEELTGKKTPLQKDLMTRYKFELFMPTATWTETADTVIASFSHGHCADVLKCLAVSLVRHRFVELDDIVRLEPNLLEIRKKAR